MNKDYYKILGIEKNASKDEKKKAFYKLAHKYHPDKKDGNEKKFKEVNEAYQILSDDEKRAKYDQFGAGYENMQGGYGAGQQGGFGGFDFSGFQGAGDFGNLNDIFSDFFGGGMSGGRNEVRRGKDISVEIEILFSEAVFGSERKIFVTKNSSCSICKGNGAKPGTKMEKCKNCGGNGKIRETRRTILGAISSTRICEVCLGACEVPKELCENCQGKGIIRREQEILVKIPSGIKNSEALRLAGMGEAIKNGQTGNLYLTVKIKVPSRISKRARELLDELKKEGV